MRAIILDLDGTLLRSMAVDCEIFGRSISDVLGSVRFRDNYNSYDNVTDRGIVEEIMQLALGRLGADFDSVTYFGDAQWDVEACQTLGWHFEAVGSELGGIASYEGLSI